MVLLRRKGPYSQRLRRQPLLLTKTTFREVIAPFKIQFRGHGLWQESHLQFRQA